MIASLIVSISCFTRSVVLDVLHAVHLLDSETQTEELGGHNILIAIRETVDHKRHEVISSQPSELESQRKI